MTVSVLVLRPDTDALEAVALAQDRRTDTHLHSLYAALRCQWVDVIRLTDSIDAWVDDEGRLNGAEPNVLATSAFRAFGWHVADTDSVRGAVAFAAHDGVGGMANLSDRQREIVENALAQASACDPSISWASCPTNRSPLSASSTRSPRTRLPTFEAPQPVPASTGGG